MRLTNFVSNKQETLKFKIVKVALVQNRLFANFKNEVIFCLKQFFQVVQSLYFKVKQSEKKAKRNDILLVVHKSIALTAIFIIHWKKFDHY